MSADPPPTLEYQTPQPGPQIIPDHLAYSILFTIFCFFPTGIVAIVYSIQVRNRLAVGDYEAALAASKRAGNWGIASFMLGLLTPIVLAILSHL